MAFSTRRGRPRAAVAEGPDYGTPELRAKRMVGLTCEPIDRCLQKSLITEEQHRCGLHLRWLYTLRYGAPSLTAHYTEREQRSTLPAGDQWRSAREQEYAEACLLLRRQRAYEPVMKLAVFNEPPAFLSAALLQRSFHHPALAEQLDLLRRELCDGLELLVQHWRQGSAAAKAQPARNISTN